MTSIAAHWIGRSRKSSLSVERPWSAKTQRRAPPVEAGGEWLLACGEQDVSWIRRYIFFHGKRHPEEMAEDEVTAFLTHLATRRKVSASTQNQALCALLFLYRHVLGRELGRLPAARARRKRKLPVVLSREEVAALFTRLDGPYRLIGTPARWSGSAEPVGSAVEVPARLGGGPRSLHSQIYPVPCRATLLVSAKYAIIPDQPDLD